MLGYFGANIQCRNHGIAEVGKDRQDQQAQPLFFTTLVCGFWLLLVVMLCVILPFAEE